MPKILPYAIAAVVLVVAVVIGVQFVGDRAPAPTAEAPAPSSSPAALPAVGKDERILGDPSAPVTIIEYASLTCPHCATFHTEVLPTLKKDYIDTGKVRLVYRNYPLDGVALRASALADCSGEDRFFGFLDVLFRTQPTWSRSADPVGALQAIARQGGMSAEKFAACLQDETLLDKIMGERLAGADGFGVDSTPSFIIQGRRYGALDVEDFREILDPLTGS